MKTLLSSLTLAAVLAPLAIRASYYDLVPGAKGQAPLAVVTYDARYPLPTYGIYIATYPHHAESQEGWGCEYYGGVQPDAPRNETHLLWSTWGITGKGAPVSGIDFVYAGPHMGWHRSTWEGSSGGVSGMWPADEFKLKHWYRFVHRVWTPTGHTPHLGYAGVWLKDVESGVWYHMATFKFPAELTGFNNMGGFMEWFANRTPDKAAAEFKNCYTYDGGAWHSRTRFTASNGGGGDKVVLSPGENGIGVLIEDTADPKDPGTGRRVRTTPPEKFEFKLNQPAAPDFFDAVTITRPTAEWLGNQAVVRWSVDAKSSPQLGYDIEVYDGDRRVAGVSENDPEARQCAVTLPAAPAGTLEVRLKLRDIYNPTSPESRFPAVAVPPLAAVPADGLASGVTYRYFQSAEPGTWSALPDFASLKAVRSGVTATPDITPRLRREGYAFAFDGFLRAPADGLYTFNLTAASGVKLVLDGQTVIDADGDRSIARYPGTVALKAGAHTAQLYFYHGREHGQADDFLQTTWSGPGFDTTPVPASAWAHQAAASEPVLTVNARLIDGIRLALTGEAPGFAAQVKRIEYFAVNDHFDYFSQQGAQSENYFLTGAATPAKTVFAPIWAGESKTIFARALLAGGRTVDSAPITVAGPPADPGPDANGMKLTVLEHHLYGPNHAVENGTVSLAGDSVNLLTKPHRGDVTIIAHLAAITPDGAIPDGTRLESANNWFSGIILRDNLTTHMGMPFGGATIPYIMVGGSADGSTRHDDSTMINGAGNQLSGDDGSDAKWFKLTRKGQALAAYISTDGKSWQQVAAITQPKMGNEIQVGFMHYSLPCAVPAVHWAMFDHLSINDSAE